MIKINFFLGNNTDLIVFAAFAEAVAVVSDSQAQFSDEITFGALEGLEASAVVEMDPHQHLLRTPPRPRPETLLPKDTFHQRTQFVRLKVAVSLFVVVLVVVVDVVVVMMTTSLEIAFSISFAIGR